MGEISPHLSSLRDPQFAYGFPQTEVDLVFFFRDGNLLSPQWCFTENPMLKPLFSGIPYSSDSGTLSQSLRFPGTSPIAPLTPRDPSLPPATHPAPSSPPTLCHHGVTIIPVPTVYPWGPLCPNSLCTASSRVTCPCRYGRCTVAR